MKIIFLKIWDILNAVWLPSIINFGLEIESSQLRVCRDRASLTDMKVKWTKKATLIQEVINKLLVVMHGSFSSLSFALRLRTVRFYLINVRYKLDPSSELLTRAWWFFFQLRKLRHLWTKQSVTGNFVCSFNTRSLRSRNHSWYTER